MKITEYIVTGGTGYVGYVVVKELIARGYSPIKVITRSKKNIERFKDLDVNFVFGDILDRDFIFKQISPESVVFHLAGIVDIGSYDNSMMEKVNVKGCINIVDACIEKKVKKLIYTSSVAIIEPLKNQEMMSEPNEIKIENFSNEYAKTKAIATKYIIDKTSLGELNAVVVYPSAIIGPYDYYISNVGQVVVDYINHKIFAYVKGGYNFVDVRDVAEGIINAYEKGRSGEGYILSGEVISIKQMFLILNEKLARDKLPMKLPLWLVKKVLPLVELHYRIRKKKPIFSSCSLSTINQNCNFNNTKAKEELGFNPRSAKEGLNDTVDWFYENKKDLINIPL